MKSSSSWAAIGRLAMAAIALATLQAEEAGEPTIEDFQLLALAISDQAGKSAFTFRREDFSGDASSRSDLPIGIFDSGIGGLTVLEAILASDNYHNDDFKPGPDGRPDFENESFIYFGDQANMPYGNYSSENRTATLREHILKNLVFLLGRRHWATVDAEVPIHEKRPVKAVVIACNTATAFGLDDLRAACREWQIPVPVIGVVEAGATGLQSIWKDKQDEAVAVFATVGTCSSGAYPRLVQSTLGRAGYGPAEIIQQGSVALAGTLEGAPEFQGRSVEAIIRDDIGEMVKRYREQMAKTAEAGNGGLPKPIGSVVLGCTHFPLAQNEIDAAFEFWRSWTDEQGQKPFRDLISEERVFIDPAVWTSKELFRDIARSRLQNTSGKEPTCQFFLSVPNRLEEGVEVEADGVSFTHDYKYGRSPNHLDREDTRIVPMNFVELPETSRNLIMRSLPEVMKAFGVR